MKSGHLLTIVQGCREGKGGPCPPPYKIQVPTTSFGTVALTHAATLSERLQWTNYMGCSRLARSSISCCSILAHSVWGTHPAPTLRPSAPSWCLSVSFRLATALPPL